MSWSAATQKCLGFALAAALTYSGWTFVSRQLASSRWTHRLDREQAARTAEFNRTYGGSGLRILQFYPRDAVITEGGRTVICYGVLNASSVRIEPPLEGVSVSPNRCVDAAPEHDTRYTLTAEAVGGAAASASFEITVKPDEASLPRITAFRVASRRIEQGQPIYLLTFSQQNGEEISIEPPEFPPLHRAPYGQFYVAPRRSTTYVLTVTGKYGHKARRELTVNVPQP